MQHIYSLIKKYIFMEKQIIIDAVSDSAGFIINKTAPGAKEYAGEIATAIEQKIDTPPSYEQTVHSSANLMREIAPNDAGKKLVDAVEDLLIHEPGETWTDDVAAAIDALRNGVKSMKEKRREERKDGD